MVKVAVVVDNSCICCIGGVEDDGGSCSILKVVAVAEALEVISTRIHVLMY